MAACADVVTLWEREESYASLHEGGKSHIPPATCFYGHWPPSSTHDECCCVLLSGICLWRPTSLTFTPCRCAVCASPSCASSPLATSSSARPPSEARLSPWICSS